jgi:hypothetical protein
MGAACMAGFSVMLVLMVSVSSRLRESHGLMSEGNRQQRGQGLSTTRGLKLMLEHLKV